MGYELTAEGKKYAKIGLPEVRLLKLKSPIDIREARRAVPELNIAIFWARKQGWIEMRNGKIYILKRPEVPEQNGLERIARGEKVDEDLMKRLLARGLIKEVRKVGKIKELTREIIKKNLWKGSTFTSYNIQIIGKREYPGRVHILTYWIRKIREIFFDLGFQEAEGPLVESAFWNFDALFVPQDHPARELAATFYMKRPKRARIPKGLAEEVGRTHEDGGVTGSRGWQYRWDRKKAEQTVLRTHTTSVSARMLSQLKPPAKIFAIGKVFRNETIDYKHLPEFIQIEGIVVDESVSFRDLLGYLKEFYTRLGFRKIRFRPAYFPYTELSVEPEVYFEEKGEWLELGGAGIFRPEVTQPLGIDCPVLAWGLGLERPIMLRLGLRDIRNFYYRNDLSLLREAKWQ